MSQSVTRSDQDYLAFLAGGGEMGERIRALDWSATPLGPIESWSPALRTMVRFLLANRFPMLLWWGPEYICIYNDPYRPVLGAKHPSALGLPTDQVWSEIWHILKPLVDTPFHGGPATWDEDIQLELNRYGFSEETHFTIAYSPVPDETVASGIGGVLATVHEITEKVVGERRVAALRDLGAGTMEARTAEDACATAARTLARHDMDVPFALLYLLEADGKVARLAGAAGVEEGSASSPRVIEIREGAQRTLWPLADVVRSGAAQTVHNLGAMLGAGVPRGPWSEAPSQAVVLPIRSNVAHQLAGFLVAGVSARLKLDELYSSFLELAASQIATAIVNARAYEEERKRAEALAELDRAKTLFFSNVSHEFRTPLTLMLGPVEELLDKGRTDLPAAAKGQLEVVNRNGLRLLRLVNTLLDFSRIEAGRVRAVFRPTDLAAYTADLASVFRAAVERAGLELRVDLEPLAEPVYVDRDMWEKVVLNLLSNAFKFTFEGGISVELRRIGDSAVLKIRDTGTGIRAEEMPRLFERFHRAENSRARTHEGSGIGLALVQELVKLHRSSIHAESVWEQGTTFTITLPLGSAHLPPEHVGEGREGGPAYSSSRANAYAEEALRWLPDTTSDDAAAAVAALDSHVVLAERSLSTNGGDRPLVLVVDDNADMRQYVVRLLSDAYHVVAAPDGEAALALVRSLAQPPELVLTDVMMPRLDGFGLMNALRADPRTRAVPIVMLSARAGEESRVEGMASGADDYLTKPFSARELLARVDAHVKMARFRREAGEEIRNRGEQFKTLIDQAPLGVYVVDADFRIREVNPVALPVFGDIPGGVIGRDLGEIVHVLWDKAYADEIVEIFRHTLETGEPYFAPERAEFRIDRNATEYYEWRVDRIALPEGRYGLVCYFRDVSPQVLARMAIAESEEKYRTLFDSIDEGFATLELISDDSGAPIDLRYLEVNAVFERQSGRSPDVVGKTARQVTNVHQRWLDTYARVVRTGEPVRFEDYSDATDRWFRIYASRVGGEGSRTIAVIFDDITERKRADEQARRTAELDAFRVQLSDALRPLADPVEIQAVAARVLGGRLRASRALFFETENGTDSDYYLVREDYCAPGVPSVVGRHRGEDFGSSVWKALRAGHRLVVSDVSSDATLSDEHRAVYEANALLAYVSVPLIKQGRHVATLSVHQTTPRAWTDEEIAMVEETAERSWAAVERARAENALRASEAKLEAQLADTKLLQQVSAEIVHDAEEHVVYRTIANAASVVMRSDFASIQMLDTERGTIGELHLLAHRGFSAQASLHWEWVRPESKTTCAAALRAGRRVVVPDIDEWNDVKGSDDLALFRGANIRAMQTTPLRTRAGKLVGMLSTHWKHVHNPSDADLQRLDILARQAADLIERKQSERELRRSEERYRDLVEQTVDGIFVADRDGRYVDVNSAGCEMLGMTRGEVLSSSFTDVLMEEDHPRLETTLAILREGEIHRGEWRFRRKDGSVFFGELVGRQLPDGRVQGVVRDITDRKQAEEALKEADRRKDEFLATLAHELRNPLAPLRNGLQVMRLTRNDGKAVEQVRNMMERQLGHMVRLIDDLLDSSRISEGKIELRKERVQLGAVVQHALETSRPLIEQAGLSLAVSVPPEPIFVDADVTRLSQVFANLLNNAAKFTESGGHVSLSVQREGSSAVVSVHDTGVGIPPSMLPKVFEMFTQVDRSLERTHGGLGIGLTIVKRLVEMHGGTIEARSGGYGMGSEFVLRLPAVAAAVKPNAAENGDGVQNGARRRVLVVDDNVDAAESLSMMLEIMGNETRMAHDGLEALDAAAGFHPDVVLLDIGMPRLNGFDACRRMREQPWGDNLVIVALTGWGQNEDRQRSHEAGFDMHMVKPVDPVDLEKLLASLETPAH